jgi:membrane-associated phospholipid phosphatase
MDSVVSAVAQYAIYAIALAALVVWVLASRTEKIELAIRAVLSLLVVLVLIRTASALHTDPRPFVVDPSVKPLFPHSPDNGFPSDHTAVGVAVAVVVMTVRRWAGIGLLAVAVALGVARVLAHVHHVQDIVAAAVIGVVAAVVGLLAARPLERRLSERVGSRQPAR